MRDRCGLAHPQPIGSKQSPRIRQTRGVPAAKSKMDEYRSNLTLPQAVAKIRQARRLVITTHAKPDGDAFGSVVTMTAALRQLGMDVTAWFMPPVPPNIRTLQGYDLVDLYKPANQVADADLIAIFDTGAWSQLMPIEGYLSSRLDRVLVVDHHIAGDLPAAWRYVDSQAAACCEIVAQIVDLLEAEGNGSEPLFTPVVREALFVGLASDTGWFRFSNTRPETHDLAARLMRLGVDHANLYRQLDQAERPQKLALQIRALDSLQMLADDRVAVMVLRAEDFIETGGSVVETDRLVEMPQVVATVQVVVLIVQTPPHSHDPYHTPPPPAGPPPRPAHTHPPDKAPIRLSFRSKPGPNAVNVAKLAQRFGGGGHARAAGAKVYAPLEQVVEQVSQAATEAVDPVGKTA